MNNIPVFTLPPTSMSPQGKGLQVETRGSCTTDGENVTLLNSQNRNRWSLLWNINWLSGDDFH